MPYKQYSWANLAILCCSCLFGLASATQSYEQAQQRLASKPWFTKFIEVGDTTLPITPATIFFVTLFTIYLIYLFRGTSCYAVASHILVSDHSPAAKAKLEAWKKEIGKDYEAFAKYAAKYSDCPSKRSGGKLGRFKKGKMVPQFERVCFDPSSKVRTTLGPVQTTFGWHLLYIEDRKLS